MKRLRALVLCLLLTGCTQQTEPVFNNQILAFGTIIDITIDGVEPALAEQVSGELEQMFLQWHHDWHAWEDGPLTQLNAQLASGKPATVDAGLLPLLIEANRLSELSNGLFNPLIGGLLELWGFQGNPLPEGTLPDPDAIRDWLAQAPVAADIYIKGNTLTSRNPRAAYDLGGFAKGYAIDRAIEHLQKRGIENAIVNTGGDLRAIGARSARRWRIGIRHPRKDDILASITMATTACLPPAITNACSTSMTCATTTSSTRAPATRPAARPPSPWYTTTQRKPTPPPPPCSSPDRMNGRQSQNAWASTASCWSTARA